MTTSTVVTYSRGAKYISDVSGGKTCYGLLGTLAVGGQSYDTVERFVLTGMDYVHLAAQDYPTAVMYWHAKLGRIINPWNGYGPNSKQNNILVHRGTHPSWFEGCLGPGKLTAAGGAFSIAGGEEAMEMVWTLCGGASGDKKGWTAKALKVAFRVTNAFPERSGLTAHTG